MDSEKSSEDETQSKVAVEKSKPIGIAGPTKSAIVDDAELDALLDDALLDFDKPLPLPKPKSQRPPVPGSSLSGGSQQQPQSSSEDMNQIWSEEFIKEATAQFEKKMREYVSQSNPAGAAQSTANLNKVVEAATNAALGQGDPGLAAAFNETIKNISSSSKFPEDPFQGQDFTKLMSSMGMGDGEGDSDDMDQLLPFMTNMMQKLLSKDLLQPVMTDIVDRYPDWLADNRQKLPPSDFEKYNQQYEHMKRICEEYSKEKETDSEEVKQKRFDLISELMLKVQFAGPPPKELVGEMGGPDAPQMDPALASQCSVM